MSAFQGVVAFEDDGGIARAGDASPNVVSVIRDSGVVYVAQDHSGVMVNVNTGVGTSGTGEDVAVI